MAKFNEKINARLLRQGGESIKQIAKQLKVSKSSVSIWCKDIILTKKQIIELEKRRSDKNYGNRLLGARVQYEKRQAEIARLKESGGALVGKLTKRDFLMAGAGVYWGEGSKYRRARVVNSDPRVIKFMIEWFKTVWGIKSHEFTLQVLINIVHKDRMQRVQDYWSDFLGIPLRQFTKTTLIKAKNKKIYENFETYFGTLVVTVQKGGNLTHRILGLIEQLGKNGIEFGEALNLNGIE